MSVLTCCPTTVAVGFRAIGMREASDEERKTGVELYHTKQELWELSCVSIPSNPNALIQQLGITDIAESALTEELVCRAILPPPELSVVASMDDELRAIVKESELRILAEVNALKANFNAQLARLAPARATRSYVEDVLGPAREKLNEIARIAKGETK